MANLKDISILKQGDPARDCLVFIRTANAAGFNYWDCPQSRSWDVAISSYGDADAAAEQFRDAEYIIAGGLSKMQAFKQFYEQVAAVQGYRRVLLLDDDIEIDHPVLRKFFEIHADYELGMAQMALTHDSHASWEITYRCPSLFLRYTNYVEVMAPCFSSAALAKIIHTFDESISTYGLDIVWPHLLAGFKIAIVDECPMRHTRPIDPQGGDFYKYLAGMGIDPDKELEVLCKRYGVFSHEMQTLSIVAKTYKALERIPPRS